MPIAPPLPNPGDDYDVWGTILNAALTIIINHGNSLETDLGTLGGNIGTVADKVNQATSEYVPGTLVKRSANGYFNVASPASAEHPTPRAWVEALTQAARDAVATATPEVEVSQLVKRSSNGHFNVPTPSNGIHPANKEYVDGQIGARLPFSSTTSTGSVAAGGGFEDVTFTFPSGKFSAAPTVVVAALHPSGNVSAQVTSRSATSCTVRIRNSGASAITISACVIAI